MKRVAHHFHADFLYSPFNSSANSVINAKLLVQLYVQLFTPTFHSQSRIIWLQSFGFNLESKMISFKSMLDLLLGLLKLCVCNINGLDSSKNLKSKRLKRAFDIESPPSSFL